MHCSFSPQDKHSKSTVFGQLCKAFNFFMSVGVSWVFCLLLLRIDNNQKERKYVIKASKGDN